MSIIVKNDLPEATRKKLADWFLSPAGTMPGIGKVAYLSNLANYKYVASLGQLDAVAASGRHGSDRGRGRLRCATRACTIVDVRNAKEYNEKHIRGAILIPYGEKSLKDVAFDPAMDQWDGPATLDPQKPVDLPLQRPRMLEVVQGRQGCVVQGIQDRVLVPRRLARMGKPRTADGFGGGAAASAPPAPVAPTPLTTAAKS